MLKQYLSPSEVLSYFNKQITLSDLKDLCRREALFPCLYIEGNIVIIDREVIRNETDPYKAAFIDTINNHFIFKGYISSSNFTDYILTPGHYKKGYLYEVEKIIECLNEHDIPSLKPNPYMRLYPRLNYDQNLVYRWLRLDADETATEFTNYDIFFSLKNIQNLKNNNLSESNNQNSQIIEVNENKNSETSQLLLIAALLEQLKRHAPRVNQTQITTDIAEAYKNIKGLSASQTTKIIAEANRKIKDIKNKR